MQKKSTKSIAVKPDTSPVEHSVYVAVNTVFEPEDFFNCIMVHTDHTQKTEFEPVTEPVTEQEAQPEPVVEPAVEPEPVVEPEVEPEVKPEPELIPGAVSEPDPDFEQEETAESKPEPEVKPEPVVEPVVKPEPELIPGAVSEPDPDVERDPFKETETAQEEPENDSEEGTLPQGYALVEVLSKDSHGQLLHVCDAAGHDLAMRLVSLAAVPQSVADTRKCFCRLMDRGEHIVRIGHAGVFNNTLYYEMPLPDAVPGIHDKQIPANLKTLYASRKAGRDTVLQLGLDLSDALDRLHKAGIPHGNITAETVAYYNGSVALGDIGTGDLPREYLPPEYHGNPDQPGSYRMEYDLYALGKLLLNIADQPSSPLLQKTAGLLCANDPKKRIIHAADARRIFRKSTKKKSGCMIFVLILLIVILVGVVFSVFMLPENSSASIPFLKKRRNSSPLVRAIRAFDREKIEKLLETENPNESGKNGVAPLHVAVLCNNMRALNILLEHKADVNQPDNRGKTALHIAAEKGNVKMIVRLLDAGAGLKNFDHDGQTPADCAEKAGHHDIAELLR